MAIKHSTVKFTNHLPEWEPSPEGGWQRHWHFEFEAPVPRPLGQYDLDDGELIISLEPGPTSYSLVVVTRTEGNRWSDDNYLLSAYRLFPNLERHFGRIREIEGLPRDTWRPIRIYDLRACDPD